MSTVKGGTKGRPTKTTETKTSTGTSNNQNRQEDTRSTNSATSRNSQQQRSSSVPPTPRSQPSSAPKTPRERKDKSPSRHNKIYRTPPTPPPPVLFQKEKTFVLDCNAVSSISNDYSKANPKLGPVVPPFNSTKEKCSRNYFTYQGVKALVKKNKEVDKETVEKYQKKYPLGWSIDGKVMDKFHTEGAGYLYLSKRNINGAGHSSESIDGHGQFMEGVRPVVGYHGHYGYRRNSPWLRQSPSPFGPVFCTHEPWGTAEYNKPKTRQELCEET